MKNKSKFLQNLNPSQIKVGVVGLGLMGSSITSCLLAAGHAVIALDISADKRKTAKNRVLRDLKDLQKEKILKESPLVALKRLSITADYHSLKPCEIAVEATFENLNTKRAVIQSLEKVLVKNAIICLNTSALPITQLQQGAKNPKRILGVHWAEPAYLTRFMEVICGKKSEMKFANIIMQMAVKWKKEPTLVKKDIRGFITNRLMYALIREAFYLVESGVTTIEGVDRSMRNDLGSWITFAGPFRMMDLTGIPAYRAVMRDLLPNLNNAKTVPKLMNQVADSGAMGTANHKGFYHYTPAEAKKWDKQFAEFSRDIRRLSLSYAEPADKPKKKRKVNKKSK